jgi:hypothetical protein
LKHDSVSLEARIVSKLTGIPQEKLGQIKKIPKPGTGPCSPKAARYLSDMNAFFGFSFGIYLTLVILFNLPYVKALTVISVFCLTIGSLGIFSFWKFKQTQYKEHYKMYLMLKDEEVA